MSPDCAVKSLAEVENTVGTVSWPAPANGGAVRPWLAQIALTG
jgi:hypothetical protein